MPEVKRSAPDADGARADEPLGLSSLAMFSSRGGAYPPPEELFAGRYAVDGQLPWGGLTSYYRASTEGTPLILCVLPMDVSRSLRAEAAFARTAQALGSIHSKAIPRILDAGVIDGVPYLAHRDTRGTLLADLLRERTLGSLTVLRLAFEVLEALQAAHDRDLVHGDLNPHNIVVTQGRDGRLAARVIGTGLLPLLRSHPDASAAAARTGSGAHAVAYMAPEIFGDGGFETSVDLYSMGALLHHMVTGSPPVGWETDEGFEDVPGLPDVIRRAMAKRPTDRYPDAASMRAALEWLEVESAKQNPHTQDIAPWMETSHIGSIPVPSLVSSAPPAHISSQHAAGKVLSTSGARPIPVQPRSVDEDGAGADRQWLRLLLLLLLLGTLALSGYWLEMRSAQRSPSPTSSEPGAQDAP